MPAVYDVAETVSKQGQARFRQGTVVALLLLLIAALFGLVGKPWAGWLSAVAFGGSIVATGLGQFRSAEDDWYDGRAVAESAKTLTWKYAVRGQPFDVGDAEATSTYERLVGEVLGELRALRSTVEAPNERHDLRPLRQFREAELPDRQAVYREQRLGGQRDWYRRRGGEHRRTARTWGSVAVVLQLGGLAAAALKGLDVIELDLLSPFATAAAGALAWLAAGDYQKTARAYGLTTLELDMTLEAASQITSEEEWARFVADAEQTMSREHTTWLARRRGS